MQAAYLDRLNGEQRAAVVHGVGEGAAPGPLLVIAGAGSGKTNTLAHRVAHLIVAGADPRRILLLTFSRRAAAEMEQRVERIAISILGKDAAALCAGLSWSGTFHAIGARLIREFAERIGLGQSFSIHDREDSADLLNLVRHELGFSAKKERFPLKGTCLSIYSRAVNAETALEDVLRRAFPWCANWEAELKNLFAAYVEAKQRQEVLDFDDLLLYWAGMMEEPGIAEEIGGRFDHVLVDEYQDTNRLQERILLRMKPDGRGLTVVGDDAQSIYSFRAATVRNILEFPGHFSPQAEIVTLDRNYRSTQPILAAANGVIGLAEERFTKDLWSERVSAEKPRLVTLRDEADQARYVVEEVLESRERGLLLKKQAVLFRSSHHSGPLEIELTRRNVPFKKYGGLKFLDAAHVKDVLAALRWAGNPRDRVAGFRVLQLMPGIGPANAGRIIEAVEAAPKFRETLLGLETPSGAETEWPRFLDLIGELDGRASWPADIDRVRRWYEPHLLRIHEDAAERGADLEQLEAIAATFPSREKFLTELTLDPPDATSGNAGPPLLDEDYLILSTIHSAKGQEWNSVFILNAVDGCIPSDLGTGQKDDIEEERRLLYVAMTRAKDHLALLMPQRFYVSQQGRGGDRHVYATRTRFIPPSLLGLFESLSWPVVVQTSREPSKSRQPVDMGAKMRAMWR